MAWPATAADLRAEQAALAAALPTPTYAFRPGHAVAGCFVCFGPPPAAADGTDEVAYAGAALLERRRLTATAAATRPTTAAYVAGLLALREGAVLEEAVRRLPRRPDVLLVNASGLDHHRGAGLAVHLGAVLDLPSVGVTHRPLLASGDWPPDAAGATAPVRLDGIDVGVWVRTRAGVRPLVAHAAWLTSPVTAGVVVAATAVRARTPEPLRRAREVARRARGRESAR